jgi:hypothetical protein
MIIPTDLSKPQRVVFILLLIAITLMKTFLATHQTIVALPCAIHDDALFVQTASTILNGNWLGIYNEVILAKGPFWPIFLALCFVMGMPSLLGEHLLFAAACLLLTRSLMPLFNRMTPWLAIPFYLLLLFHPVATGLPRILRNPIYVYLGMLVAAAAIALYLRRKELTISAMLGWGSLLGFSYAFFWMTREESIWMLPLIIMLGLCVCYEVYQHKSQRLKRAFICAAIPIVCFFIAIGWVCFHNYRHYHYFGITDIRSKPYCDAVGAITRVKSKKWHPSIILNRETSAAIAKVSPTYGKLEPLLNLDEWSKHASIWAYYVPLFGNPKDLRETDAGHYIWAFRGSVAALANREYGELNVASTNKVLKRVSDEVNKACDSGLLECGPRRSSIVAPWDNRYWKYLFIAYWEGINHALEGNAQCGSPREKQILTADACINRLFQDVILDRLDNTMPELVSGWAFHESGPLTMQLVNHAGVPFADQVLYQCDRKDVYERFKALGRKTEHALHSGFAIKLGHSEGPLAAIHFKLSDGRVSKVLLKENSWINDDDVGINVSMDELNSGVSAARDKYIDFCEKARMKIAEYYASADKITLPASLVLFAILILIPRLRRRAGDWIVCAAALMIAVLALLFVCAVVSITAFPAFNSYYLAPAFPLLLVFELVVFFACMDLIVHKKKLHPVAAKS